jgi:hypothetical protein
MIVKMVELKLSITSDFIMNDSFMHQGSADASRPIILAQIKVQKNINKEI